MSKVWESAAAEEKVEATEARGAAGAVTRLRRVRPTEASIIQKV